METKTLRSENKTITYIDEGSGEPLILLHGFCGSSHYWKKVVPALAQSYRVIAPDLPGHGGSSLLQGEYTIVEIAEHFKQFLDKLGVEKVTMFGHSFGGYITLAFAEKYPDRLNRFSLIHSTAHPDTVEGKQGRSTNIEKIKQEGIESLIDGLVPKLFAPAYSVQKDLEEAKQIGYTTSPEGAIHSLMAMRDRPDRNYVLEETKVPVLLTAGEKDQIVAPEKTFSVNKENIKHVLIQHAGHMSMFENPIELVSVIQEFLQDNQNS